MAEATNPIATASNPRVGPLERVRHLKRGTEYEVLHDCAEIQASPDSPLTDYEICVVYRSLTDGRVWVRRRPEFRDGRFETIASAPTPPDRVGEEVGRADFPGDRFEGDLTLREAALEVVNWFDKDGAAGTLPEYIMDLRAALKAALSPDPAGAGGDLKRLDRDAIADRMQEAFPDLTRLEAECAAESAFPECLLIPSPVRTGQGADPYLTETTEALVARLEAELGVKGINSVFRRALTIAKEASADAKRDHVASARLIPWESGSLGGVDLTFESGFRVALPLSKPEATPQQSPSPTTETDPCHWGGGNDIIWCSTCGAEYAYAKGEERPACPRLQAGGEVHHDQ